MNSAQTAAYLNLTDAELITLHLEGLANNREVAAAFVGGATIEESADGITFVETLDPAWDTALVYQVQVDYVTTVPVTFVAPITEKPNVGTNYYCPCLTDPRKYLIYSWVGGEGDILRLKRGLVHLAIPAAVAHADALLKTDVV